MAEFPQRLSGKESACKAGDTGDRFDPWVRKITWRRARQPSPVFLPGESHGQRSLSLGSQRVDRIDLACAHIQRICGMEKMFQLKALGGLKPSAAKKLGKLICLCETGTRLQRYWWISCSRHLWSPGANLCIYAESNSSLQSQITQASCLLSRVILGGSALKAPKRINPRCSKNGSKIKVKKFSLFSVFCSIREQGA